MEDRAEASPTSRSGVPAVAPGPPAAPRARPHRAPRARLRDGVARVPGFEPGTPDGRAFYRVLRDLADRCGGSFVDHAQEAVAVAVARAAHDVASAPDPAKAADAIVDGVARLVAMGKR